MSDYHNADIDVCNLLLSPIVMIDLFNDSEKILCTAGAIAAVLGREGIMDVILRATSAFSSPGRFHFIGRLLLACNTPGDHQSLVYDNTEVQLIGHDLLVALKGLSRSTSLRLYGASSVLAMIVDDLTVGDVLVGLGLTIVTTTWDEDTQFLVTANQHLQDCLRQGVPDGPDTRDMENMTGCNMFDAMLALAALRASVQPGVRGGVEEMSHATLLIARGKAMPKEVTVSGNLGTSSGQHTGKKGGKPTAPPLPISKLKSKHGEFIGPPCESRKVINAILAIRHIAGSTIKDGGHMIETNYTVPGKSRMDGVDADVVASTVEQYTIYSPTEEALNTYRRQTYKLSASAFVKWHSVSDTGSVKHDTRVE